jgi:hypothetical protein
MSRNRVEAPQKILSIVRKDEFRVVYTILTLVTKSREMSIPCGETDGHGMCFTKNNNTLRGGYIYGNDNGKIQPRTGIEGPEGE